MLGRSRGRRSAPFAATSNFLRSSLLSEVLAEAQQARPCLWAVSPTTGIAPARTSRRSPSRERDRPVRLTLTSAFAALRSRRLGDPHDRSPSNAIVPVKQARRSLLGKAIMGGGSHIARSGRPRCRRCSRRRSGESPGMRSSAEARSPSRHHHIRLRGCRRADHGTPIRTAAPRPPGAHPVRRPRPNSVGNLAMRPLRRLHRCRSRPRSTKPWLSSPVRRATPRGRRTRKPGTQARERGARDHGLVRAQSVTGTQSSC